MSLDDQLKEILHSKIDTFLRPKKKEFEHYTPEDVILVNESIHSMAEFLKEKLGNTYGIEEYLRAN